MSFDYIIVGAGIFGCAAAYHIGQTFPQSRILLVERDWSEPDRIVGELLQPGGIDALKIMGMEGIDAITCEGYAVIKSKDEKVVLPYLENMVGKGVVCVEGTALDLIQDENTKVYSGVTVKSKKDKTLTDYKAKLTIICDGCFSSFRKKFIDKKIAAKSHFAGLILEDCKLPVPKHGHVILAKPSPILLYQIGSNETRLLVDIPAPLPNVANGDMHSYMHDFVGPQLPESVKASYYNALQTQKVRSMPCSWLPPTKNTAVGAIILGDAQNMRHPLTGGGMTVAFWDVVHMVDILKKCDLDNSKQTSKKLEGLHWRRKDRASVVNILANALYELFSAGDDIYSMELQKACFAYFKLGGRCVSTPIGLLSAVIPEPMTLMIHFFAVALYGIFLICFTNPFYLIFNNIAKSGLVLYSACVIFFPLLWAELQ